jgi:hypothetical protein
MWYDQPSYDSPTPWWGRQAIPPVYPATGGMTPPSFGTGTMYPTGQSPYEVWQRMRGRPTGGQQTPPWGIAPHQPPQPGGQTPPWSPVSPPPQPPGGQTPPWGVVSPPPTAPGGPQGDQTGWLPPDVNVRRAAAGLPPLDLSPWGGAPGGPVKQPTPPWQPRPQPDLPPWQTQQPPTAMAKPAPGEWGIGGTWFTPPQQQGLAALNAQQPQWWNPPTRRGAGAQGQWGNPGASASTGFMGSSGPTGGGGTRLTPQQQLTRQQPPSFLGSQMQDLYGD